MGDVQRLGSTREAALPRRGFERSQGLHRRKAVRHRWASPKCENNSHVITI